MTTRATASLLGMLLFGCADALPCYPPSHFAPPAGAPYRAEEVRIATPDGHVLAGTLTLSTRGEPPFPAVVLISGAHAQNRDHMQSNREPVRRYRPFRQIADALSRRGIAVLRLDDRGVGCSGGGPLLEATKVERADDTRAGLAWLRGREEMDPQRLGLLGISEGADIALIIAADDEAVAAIVLMAASGARGWQIIESQQRVLIENDMLTDEERARLDSGADIDELLEERMNGILRPAARGAWGRWWQHALIWDPLPVARRVTSPVLILHGANDTNVPVDQAEPLAAAIRAGGNNDVTVRILPGHNHLFLEDPDGFFRRYGDLLAHTNQLSDDVLRLIADWLVEELAGAGGQQRH
ncbi:MAG: alpha/beta hydrolase [Rhodospirillales bacterium]|nr:MAG: alpha/beta hydrolase [Rhodospirillales bacterium]